MYMQTVQIQCMMLQHGTMPSSGHYEITFCLCTILLVTEQRKMCIKSGKTVSQKKHKPGATNVELLSRN